MSITVRCSGQGCYNEVTFSDAEIFDKGGFSLCNYSVPTLIANSKMRGEKTRYSGDATALLCEKCRARIMEVSRMAERAAKEAGHREWMACMGEDK